MTKVAGIWNANAESCAPAVADCHSGGGRFGNSLPSGSCSRRLLRTCSKRRSRQRTTETWERYVFRNRPCRGLYCGLSGTYCSQVPIRPPIWERHPFRTDYQLTFQTRIMLPSPHKTTDLGAPSLRNCLSIKSLNSHNTPKSLQERRLESIRFQKKKLSKGLEGHFVQNILLPGNFIRPPDSKSYEKGMWNVAIYSLLNRLRFIIQLPRD